MWPYIDTSKKRNNDNECKVQFYDEDKFLPLLTSSIAFYIPVIIIITLYYKIWVATKKRNIELKKLQAEEQFASMSTSTSMTKINRNNNNNNNNNEDIEESDEMVQKVSSNAKKKRNDFKLKKFLFNLVDKEDEIEPSNLTQTNPTSNTNDMNSSISVESNLNNINNTKTIGESKSSNEDDVWKMRTTGKKCDKRSSDFGIKPSDSFINHKITKKDKPKSNKSKSEILNSFFKLNKPKKQQELISSAKNDTYLNNFNESKIDLKNISNTSINTNNTLNNSINKKVSSLCKYCQTRKVIMQLDEFTQVRKDNNNNNDTTSKSSSCSTNKIKLSTNENSITHSSNTECKICKNKLSTIYASKSSYEIYNNNKIKIDANFNNLINKSQLNVNDLNDDDTTNTNNNQISKSNSCNLIYSNDNKHKKLLNESLNYNRKLFSENNLKTKQTNNNINNNNNNQMNNNVNNKKIVTKKLEKKNDQKAAKTLSAILLAFIITWTPYNVSVVVNTFCNNCLDKYIMWQHFGKFFQYKMEIFPFISIDFNQFFFSKKYSLLVMLHE